MVRDCHIHTPTSSWSFVVDPELLCIESTTKENSVYIADVFSCWIALLADSPLTITHGQKPKRVFANFLKRIVNSPFLETVNRFASLADDLLAGMHQYGEGSTTGPFLRDFLDTPITKEYLEFFRTGNPDILKFILSFLYFPKKAVIEDPALEPNAFRKWSEVEQRLSTLELDAQLVAELRVVVDLLLPESRHYNEAHFSGGSTMEAGRDISDKLDHLQYDPLVDRTFFRSLSGSERIGFTLEALPDPDAWIQARHETTPYSREAELRFVPKTVKTYRSICMEKPTGIYFQQSVRALLEGLMADGPLRFLIDLSDQSLNREWARIGSQTGLLDTIDLSSASDSVSLSLVRGVFPARILRYLLATRSDTVVYKHREGTRRFKVQKFAPMGSAVCFPTQCIIYSAIVIREYLVYTFGPEWRNKISTQQGLESFLRSLAKPGMYSKRLMSPRIYGDDIVTDSRATIAVITTLRRLGFEVNEAKSFQTSQAVRESCGIYAWLGEDVTPLLFKIPHYGKKTDEVPIKSVIAWVDFINRCGDYGYRSLHRVALNLLMRRKISGFYHKGEKLPIKFVDNYDEFGIFTKDPRNSHLQWRMYADHVDDESTCSQYQRDEVRVLGFKSVDRKIDTSDRRHRYEYHAWMVTSNHRVGQGTDRASRWFENVGIVKPIRRWTPG